jgi:alkaline phosphatase D
MDVSGNIATFVMNQLLTQYNASVPPEQQLPLIDDATNATLDTGISFLILGKTAFFSSTGSRYGVVKPTFDIYRAFRSAGQPENVFGEEQQAALDAFIAGSDAAYLCVANSVSTASLTWDFSQEPAFQGTDFGTAFYGNVDHFDGFPFRRGALLAALQARGNAFLISGDIHAHFLTKYVAVPELPGVVPDFTTTSISSTVFNRFVELTVEQLAPLLTPEQLERAQVLLVDELDQTLQESFANFNPGSELMVANTRDNGYVVMEVAGSGVTGRFVSFPHAEAKTSAYDAVGSLSVTERTFVYDGADVMES